MRLNLKIIMLLALTMVLSVVSGFTPTAAASAVDSGKILFVPLDNRPITDKETRQVAEKLGYDVVVPPDTESSRATRMAFGSG